MSKSKKSDLEKMEMELAEAKAQLGAKGPTPRPNPLASEEEVITKYTQTRFAAILNELDMRSRKSNKYLTVLSLVYVAVMFGLIMALFYQYSDLERGIEDLDDHLKETDEAIEKQSKRHEERSQVISGKIDETDKVLVGVSQETDALEIRLDMGEEKAEELEKVSTELEERIEEFDEVTDELAKYAQEFVVHHAISSDSPQGFDRDEGFNLRYDKFVALKGAEGKQVSQADGGFVVPSGGTYVVSGWFSTRILGALINSRALVETEVRVDGSPVWKGFSHVNGNFSTALPLGEGQTISIYATVRYPKIPEPDPEDEEAEVVKIPDSGTIESGEIRISRIGYIP